MAYCLAPISLETLDFIIGSNEGNYNNTLPYGPPGDPDPGLIAAYQNEAHNLYNGLAATWNNTFGSLPLTIPEMMLDTIALVGFKMIADSVQFRYITTNIAGAQAQALSFAQTYYNLAIGYTQQIYNLESAHLGAAYNQAIGYASTWVNQSIAHTNALYNQAISYTQGLYNASIANADNLYNLSIGHTDALYNQALAYTDTAVNGVQGQVAAVQSELTSLVGTDVASLVQSITNVANTAEQQVTNAVQQAESFATNLVGGLGVGAIATTLAQLQSQVSNIQTDTDTCLAPLCDSVTPHASNLGKLGSLLDDLTDVALLGLLLALLEEAAHNPGQVVADAESDLSGLVSDVFSGIKDLVGV